MALVGFRYMQASDPGAVGAGYEWFNTTTGALKIRNTANSSWVSIGNSDQANLGLIPKTGGSVTGALTGATGWAASTGNDFTSFLMLNGADVATENYVDSQITTLSQSISNLIEQALSTYSSVQVEASSTDIRKYVGIAHGSYSKAEMDSHVSGGGNGIILPRPQYTLDGVNHDFAYSQCSWLLSIDRTTIYDEVAGDRNLVYSGWVKTNGTTYMEDLTGELPGNNYKCWPRIYNDGWGSYENAGWSYLIIGLRSDGE